MILSEKWSNGNFRTITVLYISGTVEETLIMCENVESLEK